MRLPQGFAHAPSFRASAIDRRGRAAAGERAVGGARRRHRPLSGARRPTDRGAAARHHRASPACAASAATTRGWTIGATTTWTDVVRADLPPLFDALKAAAREVGGVQIQNTGTVAGNVCNASPAADGTPVLLALGARVVLQSARGERELPLDRVRARQPAHGACRRRARRRGARSRRARARARSAFAKLGGRRYLTISISTVAVVVDVDAAGAIVEAGVAVGSCSAVAQRLPALEARLLGVAADARPRRAARPRRPRAADADRRPARQRRVPPRRDRDAGAPRPARGRLAMSARRAKRAAECAAWSAR